jgi:hypothetical protein
MNQSDSVLPSVVKTSLVMGGDGSIDTRSRRSRSRLESIDRATLGCREEALVVDERSNVRPAQAVESKLTRMLKDASLPISHLQMRGLLRSR